MRFPSRRPEATVAGMRTIRGSALTFICFVSLAAGLAFSGSAAFAAPPTQVELVKDIEPAGTDISGMGTIDDRVIFTAQTAESGRELWATDGTPGGARLIVDIVRGTEGSRPSEPVMLDGLLYFIATNPDDFQTLWRTDGTADGTKEVFAPEADPELDFNFEEMTASGGKLFITETEAGGLWVSEGGDAGQISRTDLVDYNSDLEPFKGGVVFEGRSEDEGFEPWISDGSRSGTELLSDIDTAGSSQPQGFTVLGDERVLFTAARAGDRELWSTDGSPGGTKRVADINPEISSRPLELVEFAGSIFFSASGVGSERQIWRSDGTSSGTSRVSEIDGGSVYGGSVRNLTVAGDLLFFSANESGSGFELWRTDGTDSEPERVADINPSGDSSPASLTNVEGTLYFTAEEPAHGRELWASDGTANGTRLAADAWPGVHGSRPSRLFAAGDQLLMSAYEPSTGAELWRASDDGPAARLEDLNTLGAEGSDPDELTALGDRLLFLTGRNGNSFDKSVDMWSANAEGANRLVRPRLPDVPRPDIGDLETLGAFTYFGLRTGERGELWRTDGTSQGATRIKLFGTAESTSRPRRLTAIGSEIYFSVSTPEGPALWVSDGSPGGTTNLTPDDDLVSVGRSFIGAGDRVFFVGRGGSPEAESLWVSDGTPGGTERVRSFVGGIRKMVALGDDLVFIADDGTNGLELWFSDGTPSGTQMTKNIGPGSEGARLQDLVELDGEVLFGAYDGGTSTELWRTDGTEANTVRVTPADDGTYAYQGFVRSGEAVFMLAINNGTVGRELWKVEELGQVPELVKDISPGDESSYIEDLTPFDGGVAFEASDNGLRSGVALWTSDGTEAGTTKLADIYPNGDDSIEQLTVVGDDLYFSADDRVHGPELWAARATTPPPPPPPDTTPPPLSFASGPAGPTRDRTPTFRFGSTDPTAYFRCEVDRIGGFNPCVSPKTVGPLSDGPHVLRVRATDPAGNPTVRVRAFTVDTKLSDYDVTARKKQKQKGKRVKVKVKAGAAERITAKAIGKVTVKGSKRTFALKPERKAIGGGKQSVLRLKPKKKRDNRKILRLIKRGKKLKAPISVRGTDALGNNAAERRVVRLKKQRR